MFKLIKANNAQGCLVQEVETGKLYKFTDKTSDNNLHLPVELRGERQYIACDLAQKFVESGEMFSSFTVFNKQSGFTKSEATPKREKIVFYKDECSEETWTKVQELYKAGEQSRKQAELQKTIDDAANQLRALGVDEAAIQSLLAAKKQ